MDKLTKAWLQILAALFVWPVVVLFFMHMTARVLRGGVPMLQSGLDITTQRDELLDELISQTTAAAQYDFSDTRMWDEHWAGIVAVSVLTFTVLTIIMLVRVVKHYTIGSNHSTPVRE